MSAELVAADVALHERGQRCHAEILNEGGMQDDPVIAVAARGDGERRHDQQRQTHQRHDRTRRSVNPADPHDDHRSVAAHGRLLILSGQAAPRSSGPAASIMGTPRH